jgi:aminoglycoside 3-N-acetyltransferase
MHTELSLLRDLTGLGIPRGGILVVHSGYRALGAVDGGPPTVVAALVAAVGPAGTVLVPTFTNDLVDPYTWPVPPPPAERERLLAEMRDYDAATSEPHKMGAIARAVWKTPGAKRSLHPVTSWAALGPAADELLDAHSLDDPEGVDSPLGRAWRRDARVLLLGTDHDTNTSIHLAESVLDMPHLRELPDRYPARDEAGNRIWRPIGKTTKCSDGFTALGPHLEQDGAVRHGRLGNAIAMLMRARDVVRVAAEVLVAQPTALLCEDPECVHCPTSRRVLAGWRPAQRPELLD